MANLTGFNANEHEGIQSFEPLPNGEYAVIIEESDMLQCGPNASDPNGKYLKLKFQVIEGQHKGRTLWSNLNLVNKNSQTVQIAQRELATICKAVNVPTPKDSSDLHRIPLIAVVVCEKRRDNGEMANRIKNYKPTSGMAAAVGQQTQAQTEAKADDTPPYLRTDKPAWEQ